MFMVPFLASINDNGVKLVRSWGIPLLYSNGLLSTIETPENIGILESYSTFPVNNENQVIGIYGFGYNEVPRKVIYDLDDGTFDIVLLDHSVFKWLQKI